MSPTVMAYRQVQIPWLRVVAEGLVIVVSILSALAIEAWWQQRQDRLTEAEYLVALVAETEANVVQVGRNLETADRSIEALERADRIIGAGLHLDSAAILIQSLALGVVYLPIPRISSAVFQDLTSTGSLSLIQSAETRRQLLEYRTFEDAQLSRALNFSTRIDSRLEAVVSRHIPHGAIDHTDRGSLVAVAPGWTSEELRPFAAAIAAEPTLSSEIRAELRRLELLRVLVQAFQPQFEQLRSVLGTP